MSAGMHEMQISERKIVKTWRKLCLLLERALTPHKMCNKFGDRTWWRMSTPTGVLVFLLSFWSRKTQQHAKLAFVFFLTNVLHLFYPVQKLHFVRCGHLIYIFKRSLPLLPWTSDQQKRHQDGERLRTSEHCRFTQASHRKTCHTL